MARLRVFASSEVVSPKEIELKFVRSSYEPQKLFGLDVSQIPPLSVNFPNFQGIPTGTITNTFVDEEIRICRALSSIFVLVK
eukprot:CAMPEP_0182427994 /NCGR_PEP_ID=MMETSP1167-20130531/20941_1 /TAXON_ID=2988 /ORGANISM="Mallomonas Sp, Strain CCMP3275" /LENGTH=81 /DNA_ID=CAMNT_0024610609 /DNA_START=449 /DNA_END=691 /DNA_ORIENTATION=-